MFCGVWPWNRFERLFVFWTYKKDEMNFLIEDFVLWSVRSMEIPKIDKL